MKEVGDIEHSVDVTAPRLSYEAIATGLATLQQDSWVGVGWGFTTVTVLVPAATRKV